MLDIQYYPLFWSCEGLSFELTCTVEELPDEEVSITCETDRVLESLTCFVDDEPPQPCERHE